MSLQNETRISNESADQFGVLHRNCYGKVLNGMTAILRDREAAEDITATALARAFENLGTFRGKSSLFTWVYKIALNEARRARSQKRAVSLDSLESIPSELAVHDAWDETYDRSLQTAKIRKALNLLPRDYRRALVNHFVNGHPVKMIARRERVPVGTVLSRIFRAKRLLRATWED